MMVVKGARGNGREVKTVNALATQITHCAMGTVMTHKAFGSQAEVSLAAVCNEIARIEALFSRFSPDSEIGQINRFAGEKSQAVSPETFEVLCRAVEFSRISAGCFDLTIAPLVSLWKIGKEALVEPTSEQIREALALVNFEDLILNPDEMSAGLRKAGQSIDLGGIGKGYAGDLIRKVFAEYGLISACSNMGGNVVAQGAKPDGSAWQIGIQHPRMEKCLVGAVSVVDQAVVTSGDYQRFSVGKNGNRRHHLLNPLTGYPSDSGLISATIVADQAMTADALASIMMIAGLEKGLEVLSKYPRAEAVLIDEALGVHITPGVKDRFKADENIRLNIL